MTQQLELMPTPFHMEPRIASPRGYQDRDAAMRAIVEFAGRRFIENAKAFVLDYLGKHGEASGEDITDACIAAGIVPLDQRHFGPVFMSLARRGQIRKAGWCPRRKGHGTSGGVIWKLSENAQRPTPNAEHRTSNVA